MITLNACKCADSFICRKQIHLFLCWIVGFVLGFGFHFTCSSYIIPMMRSVLNQPVSIVGMLASVFLPFCFTYISVITNKPIYILIVSFIKAMSFAFAGAALSDLYDSATWLVRFLFLFSDYCLLPFLFWLWYEILADHQWTAIRNKFYLCLSIGITASMINYLAVIPFLSNLLL